MASTDWTSISNGSGVFAVVFDAAAPSATQVMQITTGGQHFQNITGGPFKNSRISAWFKQVIPSSANTSQLVLRSLNTDFSATSTYFIAKMAVVSSTNIEVQIQAVVAGAPSTLFATTSLASVNGNPQNTFQQYRFSAFNSGASILLRLEQWNGAAFIPLVDISTLIATFPTLDAAGSGRFGAVLLGTTISIDDANFYSLT